MSQSLPLIARLALHLLVCALAWAAAWPAQAAIVVVGTSYGRNEGLPTDGSPGALTMVRPTGVKPGMALVASIAVRPRLTTVTVPSGWVLMTWTDQADGGSSTPPYGMTLATYYKIATTSEPSGYTWTFANSSNSGGAAVGAMLAITGIDTASGNPIDDNGNAWVSRINPSGTSFSTGNITTVTPNTTIVSSITFLSASSFDPPSGIPGITEAIDVSGPASPNATGITLQMATATRAATGPVGPVTSTTPGSPDHGIGHLMAMQPSGIDPELSMTRSPALSPGGAASYVLTTTNTGLAAEPGPLTIINTLPSGLSYTGHAGSGWVCSASGQTITCTRSGALASGATAPSLTLNVSVGAGVSGPVSNSATVSGTGGDGNTYNNTAVDTYVIPTAPYAWYPMDEAAWGSVSDASGHGRHASALGNAAPTGSGLASPALPGSPGSCGAGNVAAASGSHGVLTPVSPATLGPSGTIAFWYAGQSRWNDGTPHLLLDASADLGSGDRHFYLAMDGAGALHFSLQDSAGTTATARTPSYGYPAGEWHHITLTWQLGGSRVAIFVDGVLAATDTTPLNGSMPTLSTLLLGGQRMAGVSGTPASYTANSANGLLDELRLYTTVLSDAEIQVLPSYSHTCSSGIDHYELSLATSQVSCQSASVTITACTDASSPCTAPATTLAGQTATLGSSGGALALTTVSFNASGVASTTLSHPGAAQGAVVAVSLSGEQSLASNPRKCCPGGSSCSAANSCSITWHTSGLLFDVPHHRAEASQTVSVSAVKKADNSLACTPAFANVSRSVNFKCAYANPGSGSLPVRVGGSALNAAASTSAACDASGQAVSLAFDATGKASTTVQYADVGQLTLTATYTGSAATGDAGLVMTGSDGFTAAPYYFGISGVSSGTLAAGQAFLATVSARNYANAVTPNFGRESTAESVNLGFVRTSPHGTGASNGSFSGGHGSFSGGQATASNLAWSEVGRGELSALLASNSYLGSGLSVAGATNGYVSCAGEGGTCTLPAGVTAWVAYGTDGFINSRSGVTGSIACNNTSFGDPRPGAAKGCAYFVTSGSSAASNGAVGPFKPHHFDISTGAACGSFSYGGQPFSATITARNAAGSTTLNYDGSSTTAPSYARSTVLSDANALGLGTLSGATLGASAFLAGVASALPAYTFSTKTTAPQSLVLRASDGDGTSSAGFAEPAMPLRSGRLRLSNAFGSARASLQLSVTADYWSGSSWVLNNADSCTSLGAASVVRSNPRSATGAPSSASSTAGSVALASGGGMLTLGAPSPAGSSLSLDIALNLGSTSADQSCNTSHPASTGAGLPWLRSHHGSCASTGDRDPAARASFGLFSPESRKSVHVREMF